MKIKNLTIGVLTVLMILFVVYALTIRDELYERAKENFILKDSISKMHDLVEGYEEKLDEFEQRSSTEFLSLFKNIEPTNLHVYPPTWGEGGQIKSSQFNGLLIDANKYAYIDNQQLFPNIEGSKEGTTGIYAVGKFEIDSTTLALLFRQHSQYDESIVQLMLWDKKTHTLSTGIDLADSFGDEGWYFVMESWINNRTETGVEIVTRRKDSEYNEEKEKSSIEDSLVRHVYREGAFVEAEISTADTIKYPLKTWR